MQCCSLSQAQLPTEDRLPRRTKGLKLLSIMSPLASALRSIRVGIARVVVAPGTTHVRSATGATP